MDWWIITVLAVAIIILASVYRISLRERENRQLKQYLLRLILQEEVYRAARIALSNFVASSDAMDAARLNLQVYKAVGKAAANISEHRLLVPQLLWELKLGKIRLRIPASPAV